MNPIVTAQYGMFAAAQRFDASAQRTAGAAVSGSPTDLAQEAVTQIGASEAFKANIAVLKVADRMQQDTLDLLV
jgi:flagellar hook protein FlgE